MILKFPIPMYPPFPQFAKQGDILIQYRNVGDGMELTKAMNEFVRSNDTVCEFQLTKDATNWGKEINDCFLFSLIPPWVHINKSVDSGRVVSYPQVMRTVEKIHSPIVTPLPSGRTPFGPQTLSGNLLDAYIDTQSRSFRY